MPKISFITTVVDDPKGLKVLLDSLKKQTKQPDEIIVIDGEETGTNRAQGRNLAIKKAKGEIIVASDAGCRLDKKWLEEIIRPFKDPEVEVVAGFYEPLTKNVFQKCLACYTCVRPFSSLRESPFGHSRSAFFLPSSRSIAFRKRAWQKVGGYPENLDYCEDLVFAQNLKEAGFQFKFAPQAVVYWPQRENIFQAFKQFFHYASGDIQAWYWPHLKKIGLVFWRYLFFVVLGQFIARLSRTEVRYYNLLLYCSIALLLYSLWAIGKNYRYVRHPLALIYLPLLQITADLGVMAGSIAGLVYSRRGV